MEILNRKARYDYEIEDTYEAGIVLVGTEVKALRAGKANIKDSYAIIKSSEVFLLNSYIALYEQGNKFNHDERRSRKLLLAKSEILKLANKVDMEGYTLIPLKVYFKRGLAKVLIGVAKGKKNYDKRQAIKERDIKREMDKAIRF